MKYLTKHNPVIITSSIAVIFLVVIFIIVNRIEKYQAQVDTNNLQQSNFAQLTRVITKDGIIEKTTGPKQPVSRDFKGYIIEFKSDPIAVDQNNSTPITLVQPLQSQINNEHTLFRQDLTTYTKIPADHINREWSGGVFNGVSIRDLTESQTTELKKLAYVKAIYPNYTAQPLLMDSVPLIGADKAWQLKDSTGKLLNGQGMRVGIIDTGIDYTLADFGSCQGVGGNCRVKGGYNFITNTNDPKDDIGHGTHVAGIVAADGAVKGVAPKADIYSYKVCNPDGCSYDDIISAIAAATDPNGDHNYSDHLDAINISIGGYGDPDDSLSQAVDNASALGVVSAIAAGNSGDAEGTIESPGTARTAITVAASWKKDMTINFYGEINPKADQIATFSSRGPVSWIPEGSTFEKFLVKPDVTAPGALICSSRYDSIFPSGEDPFYVPCLDDKHILLAGTSMASPHVAGLALLVKQQHKDWTVEEIKQAIRNSSKKIVAVTPQAPASLISYFGKLSNYFTSVSHALAFSAPATPTPAQKPYSIFTQGFGRIQALQAVQAPRPLTAQITTSGEINDLIFLQIPVLGSASGNGFDHYTLSWAAMNDQSNYHTINTSTSPVSNQTLGILPTSTMSTGQYLLKLSVEDQNHAKTEDFSMIEIVHAQIAQPADLATPAGAGRTYSTLTDVKISGMAVGSGFNNYQLSWCRARGNHVVGYPNDCSTKPSSDGIELVNNGQNSVYKNDLGTWKISTQPNLQSSFYWLILTVNYANRVETQTVLIYLDSQLMSGWPVTLADNQMASDNVPTLSDINGDGKQEIITTDGEKLAVYNYLGTLLWQKTFNGTVVQGDPAVGDVDGDGKQEIAIGVNDGYVYLYDYLGNSYHNWRNFNTGGPYDKFIGGISLADLNNDSKDEVIVRYNDSKSIAVVNLQGQLLTGWPKTVDAGNDALPGDLVLKAPVIGDINADGKPDIVTTYSYCKAGQPDGLCDSAKGGFAQIIGYDLAGNNLFTPLTFNEGIPSAVVVANFDHQGTNELVFETTESVKTEKTILHVMHIENHQLVEMNSSWPKSFNIDAYPKGDDSLYQRIRELRGSYNQLAVGKLTNDRSPDFEIVAVINRCVYVFESNSTVRSGWPKCFANTYELKGRPIIAQMDDNSNDKEIVVTSWRTDDYNLGYLVAYKQDGTIVGGFPKRLGMGVMTLSAPVGDIDGDGLSELMAISYHSNDQVFPQAKKLYVWKLNGVVNTTQDWPQSFRDASHTSKY